MNDAVLFRKRSCLVGCTKWSFPLLSKKRKNPRRLATCTFFFRRAHVREFASRFRMTYNNLLGFAGFCALSGGIQLGRRSRNPSRYRRLSLEDNMICVPSGKAGRFAYSWQHVAEDGVAQGCLHKPRWLAFGLISFEATLEETLDAWM